MNNIKDLINQWLNEDDLNKNFFYNKNLPTTLVQLDLKIKSDVVLSGVDFFIEVFKNFGVDAKIFQELLQYEGKVLKQGSIIKIHDPIPFNIAVSAERLALNLLHHSTAISTNTKKFVDIAQDSGIKILDTRKTTPGLRLIEKYAVRIGGGYNHRFGQTDTWMIKDNHKYCMGGLEPALKFFKDQGVFYNEIIVEIHNVEELIKAKKLGVKKIMLDNFSVEDIHQAINLKSKDMSYEVSGGINLQNISEYLIKGVDAISTSQLIAGAPRIDLSLKYHPLK